MVVFKAINPNTQVIGDGILAMVNGLGTFKSMALDILSKNGINNPERNSWYSQQAYLDAFKEVAQKIGPNTLYQIGTKVPEDAVWPPDIKSIEAALSSIDIAYHMNHRINGEVLFNPDTGVMKEGIGHYTFEKTGEKIVKMTCNNPYPCAFDRGIISSTVKMFSGRNLFPKLEHENENICRDKGSNSCVYIISWN